MDAAPHARGIARTVLRFLAAQPLRALRTAILGPALAFYGAAILFGFKGVGHRGWGPSDEDVLRFAFWVGGVDGEHGIQGVAAFAAVAMRALAPVYVAVNIAAAVRGRRERVKIRKLLAAHLIAGPVAWGFAAFGFAFGGIAKPGAEVGLVGMCAFFATLTIAVGCVTTLISRTIDMTTDAFVERVVGG